MKHIAIFYMSLLSSSKANIFRNTNGNFNEVTYQTNETALKYFSWSLAKQSNPEVIDKVFAFVSEKAERQKCADAGVCNGYAAYNWLIESMESYHKRLDAEKNLTVKRRSISEWIESIQVGEGDVIDSFVSLNKMAVALQRYLEEIRRVNPNEKIVLHVDLTGGYRHSAFLMLALIQMMKYSGITIGSVVYSQLGTGNNSGNGVIDDVKSLMDIYTLISGSEEFTTFGSVEQVRILFDGIDDKSQELNNLLKAMVTVSETLKVCGRKEDVTTALKLLRKELSNYKIFLNQQQESMFNRLPVQEQFFAKLLPTIENEYSDILSEAGNLEIPNIIKWCLRKGLLQQAITLYSEWLPGSIINKKLKVNDSSIKDDCEQNSLAWVSWQQYFLKSYVPNDYVGHFHTIKDFRLFMKKYENVTDVAGIDEMLRVLDSKENTNATKQLLEEIKTVAKLYVSEKDIVGHIINLDEKDALRRVFMGAANKTKLDVYLTQRFKNISNSSDQNVSSLFVQVAIKAITYCGNIHMIEIVGLPEKIEKDANNRSEVFRYLFANGRIQIKNKNLKGNAIKVAEEDIIVLINDYNQIVSGWRNLLNHASLTTQGLDTSREIKNVILDSLNKLERK